MTALDPLARVREMREANVMHWYNQGAWALKNEDMPKALDALEAVLAIKDRPIYDGSPESMWRSEAWNQALTVVRSAITTIWEEK